VKRTRIRAVSTRRTKQLREEVAVKKLALARDKGCVARWYVGTQVNDTTVPECFGRLEKDEIVSRSRGGSPTDLTNVQILCAGHNVWKEDHPTVAVALGLAKHSWAH